MAEQTERVDVNKTDFRQAAEKFYKPIGDQLDKLNLPPFIKNKYFVIGLAVLAAVVIIWVVTSVSTTLPQIPTYTVSRENFLVTITESGEIQAKNSVPINAPRIRGTLKIIYLAPEGKIVKPGEVLVKFDPTESIAKVKEEEAKLSILLSDKKKLVANQASAVAKMKSQLQSAEISFELSKLKLEQIKYEAEAVQQEQRLQFQKDEISYVQTKKEYDSMISIHESEMSKMDKEIEQQRLELEEEQRELASLTITSKTSGLVVYSRNWSNNGRKYAVGDDCWRGANILTLPDLSEMESLTYVNEVDISKVKDSLMVEVKLDAFQDSVFNGTISQVASLGREKGDDSNLKVFEVIVSLSDSSDILKPGMTTSNKIIINEIPDVLFVPHESIFQSEGKSFVFVQNGSSFDRQEVTVGEKGEDFIVITAGLGEGDIVALRDPYEEVDTESENTGSKSKLLNS
jgi:multidrug efflux pump subunit AcrA (membrane-fusion protein)